jgi:isoquinoline 1-oxidoreductase alpha subunit
MIKFSVNDTPVEFEGDPSLPLLWFLRDQQQLIGTKFGCGIGACGACTVHLNDKAARSCSVPLSSLHGAKVTTIESIAEANGDLHPVQQAWLELDVPQCGYCQAGQIMATIDFLKRYPKPTDEQIDKNLTNLCRCGTYTPIRKAIHRAAELNARQGGKS